MAHKSMLKGGAFRLNLHPVECFDRNPYKFDKPLPPPKKTEEKKHITLPFKPSSPNKKVRKGDQMQCKNVNEMYMERVAILEHFVVDYFGDMFIFCRREVWKQERLIPTPPTLQNPMVPKRPNPQWWIRK